MIYRDAAKSNRQLAGTKLRNWRNLEPVEDVELSGNYLYQCGNARSDYTTDTFKQLKVTFLHLHFVPNNNFLFYFVLKDLVVSIFMLAIGRYSRAGAAFGIGRDAKVRLEI